MEIERKFTVKYLPENLEEYPKKVIEQGYISRDPVIRIRRSGDSFTLTVKGSGLLMHEEFELPLTAEAYASLLKKADGVIIKKERYIIPFGEHTIELDVFSPPFAPLIMAEVEFPSLAEAHSFTPPDWFENDVTEDPAYYNANMTAVK